MPNELDFSVRFDSRASVLGAQSFTSALTSMQSIADRTTLAVGGLTAALGGFAAVNAVQTFANFERSMDRVRALTSATTSEFEQLNETAARIGRTTELTASDAAGALGFLAQAGFNVQQSLQAVDSVVNASIANMTDLQRVADIASNAVTGFGLAAEETTRIIDIMTETARSSNTNFEQLGSAFEKVAPIAASLGISAESAAAALGVLGNAGIQAERGGTQLAIILTRLAEAGHDLSGPDGIATVFRELETQTLNVNEAIDLFGRRALAAGSVLTENTDIIRQLSRANEQAAGTTAQLADEMTDNLLGSLNSVRSAFESLQIALGDRFSDNIRGGLDSLTDVLRRLATNTDLVVQSFQGLGIFLAGTAGISLFTRFAGVIGTVGGAFGNLARLNLGGFVSSLSGIAGSFAGIAGVSTAVVAGLSAFRDTFINSDQTGVRRFGLLLDSLVERINDLVGFAFPSFSNFQENLGERLNTLGEFATEAVLNVVGFFDNMVSSFLNLPRSIRISFKKHWS